jgi:hypothetical protein
MASHGRKQAGANLALFAMSRFDSIRQKDTKATSRTRLAGTIELTIQTRNDSAADVEAQAGTTVDTANVRASLYEWFENTPGRGLVETNPGIGNQQFKAGILALSCRRPPGLDHYQPRLCEFDRIPKQVVDNLP